MAEDYYKTLGVPRNAPQADILKAYRDLARKNHPDMNPDDPKAKKKFQEIQSAFDVLNNPEKREMYDRYGSSFETVGQGAPQGGRGPGAGGGFGTSGFSTEDIDFSEMFGDGGGGGGPAGLGDIFSHFRRAAGGRGGAKRRASDVESEVTIPFNTSILGGEVQLGLQRPNGQTETIVVKVPPGIDDGKKIRLRGQGEKATARGTPGDLLLTVRVAPHPVFSRKGNDLSVRLPVTLGEAVGGASVDVPAPSGMLSLQIPPGTSSGKKLRIKGQGIGLKNGTRGDLFVEIQIVLPAGLSDAERDSIREIDQRHPSNPRQNLRW